MKRFSQVVVALAFNLVGCNSFASVCEEITGTLRSAGPVHANLISTGGQLVYRIHFEKLSSTERQQLLRSVGQEVTICLAPQKFVKVSKGK